MTCPDPSTISTSSTDGETRSSSHQRRTRHVTANDMISAMVERIPFVNRSLEAVHGLLLTRDTRLNHMRYRPTKSPDEVGVREQILLSWACMSLAKDFATYERECGWVPKLEILGDRIIRGASPDAQAIGKHLQGFLSTYLLKGTNAVDLDTAIRQGTKMIIMEQIGDSIGFGHGMSFLVTWQSGRLLRLNYDAFPPMMALLRNGGTEARVLAAFCATHASWWMDSFQRYHDFHGGLSLFSLGAPINAFVSTAFTNNSNSPTNPLTHHYDSPVLPVYVPALPCTMTPWLSTASLRDAPPSISYPSDCLSFDATDTKDAAFLIHSDVATWLDLRGIWSDKGDDMRDRE